MDHDAYMNRVYGIQQRQLHYLKPHQMTRKELKAAIPEAFNSISIHEMFMTLHHQKLRTLRESLRKALIPKSVQGTNLFTCTPKCKSIVTLRESIEREINYIEAGEGLIKGYHHRISEIRELLNAPTREIKGRDRTGIVSRLFLTTCK